MDYSGGVVSFIHNDKNLLKCDVAVSYTHLQCREIMRSDCRANLPGTALDSVLRLLSPLM